jgi:hypothetical protein
MQLTASPVLPQKPIPYHKTFTCAQQLDSFNRIVKKHVQPTMLRKVEAGEAHDLPNPLPVSRNIAGGLSLLAHWLGVIGTLEQFNDTVIEQFTAV